MWWHTLTHGRGSEGGNWRMECVTNTLHTTSEHGVSSVTTADPRTPRLPVVDWTDTPAGRFKWARPFRAKDEIWFLRVCYHISIGLYQWYPLGGVKESRCVGLTTLPHSYAEFLEIIGAWNSWSPKCQSRSVKGYLNLYLCLIAYCSSGMASGSICTRTRVITFIILAYNPWDTLSATQIYQHYSH